VAARLVVQRHKLGAGELVVVVRGEEIDLGCDLEKSAQNYEGGVG
jgi:hypothetical protein